MRVAVVHDWLVVKAGAEAVLEQILKIYPEADVFCVVNFMKSDDAAFLKGHRVTPSFIQKLPFAEKKYRGYLPLMPLAIEQLDLSGYDLVISSSHAVAKGVITGPDQVHVSYVHSPIRYAWDLQHSYLKEAGLVGGVRSVLARIILHYMRLWDLRTANGCDVMIANAHFIARRIHKIYRREAEVIYPPVNIDDFTPGSSKDEFYFTASRFVPYKKIPLIVEAFARMPEKKLIVIGDGPEAEKARAVATPNVTFLGYQPRPVLVDHMRRAKAFVFAAEEDFGIVPVEAQACGTPVIAFGKGGALETVVDGKTGLFFGEQTAESIIDAVRRFDMLAGSFDGGRIRQNAERFGPAAFRQRFKAAVDKAVAEARGGKIIKISGSEAA